MAPHPVSPALGCRVDWEAGFGVGSEVCSGFEVRAGLGVCSGVD